MQDNFVHFQDDGRIRGMFQVSYELVAIGIKDPVVFAKLFILSCHLFVIFLNKNKFSFQERPYFGLLFKKRFKPGFP